VIPEPYQLVLLALIAGRLWKLIGDDDITERPREWVLSQLEDRRGSGDYWGQFITCPWCAGAWLSLIVYIAWIGTLGDWPDTAGDVLVGLGVWLAISSLVGWYGHLLELGT
jgi:hypothetical protein